MNITVLSGKGGAGKTLVAVNLAAVAKKSTYIDCDIEEPNGHLFFKPQAVKGEEVAVLIPQVNHDLCDGCRRCIDFCRYNALAYIKERLIVLAELCHSCGGCNLVCPQKALVEIERPIGKIQTGISGPVTVKTGILNIGEASGVTIIKQLLAGLETTADSLTIIDSPPGSACNVMESVKEADYCILVAEPTLFGVHNLNLVYELVKLFNKSFGVVINKCLETENPAEKFCVENNINILARIPFDRELGLLNSNAEIAVREKEEYRVKFSALLNTVAKEVRHEAAAYSQR